MNILGCFQIIINNVINFQKVYQGEQIATYFLQYVKFSKTALKQNWSFEMQGAVTAADICFPLCLLEIAIYGFIG